MIGKGIVKLTHLVDLVASVHNSPGVAGRNSADDGPKGGESGNAQVSEPVLRFVSMVDRSGNWDLIKELTTGHH